MGPHLAYVAWTKANLRAKCHLYPSIYDRPLPKYSVFAADTLREIVTLTFDLLTLVSGHIWRVT